MDILNKLIGEVNSFHFEQETELRIDNIIIGKSLYTMKNSDKVFTDMNFCLVLLNNSYGFSYFQEEIDYSMSKFVNKNALFCLNEEMPRYMKVAIVDALYSCMNQDSLRNFSVFSGSIRTKATERAQILVSNIPEKSKVLLIGAATEIIEEALSRNCKLKVLDLCEQKVGLQFDSTSIESSLKLNLEHVIMDTDFIVATGMIIANGSADEIFRLSNKHNKHLILFMESGSHFGPQLMQYGAQTVLSEFFPFYDFCGNTKYKLFRAHGS